MSPPATAESDVDDPGGTLLGYQPVRFAGERTSVLQELRFGRHPEGDRVVFDFTGPPPASHMSLWIRSIEQHLRVPDLDNLYSLPESAFALQVVFAPVDDPNQGALVTPLPIPVNECDEQPDLEVVTECLAAADESGEHLRVLLGLTTPTPWEAQVIDDRLVIDLRTAYN